MHRRRGIGPRQLGASAASGLVAALLVLTFAPTSVAATAPPLFFNVRLEGYALRSSTTTSSTTLNPSPAYSFAKVDSAANLDGERNLQMKATGTTNDPGDLGGAALFTPDSPTKGTAEFPNFSEAFFPAFEALSQTQVAEKCAVNNQPKEEPACRQQPGPYALARVTPDVTAPAVIGYGRNGGTSDQTADTFSRSQITVAENGAVIGRQVNAGRDQSVPGTPIQVKSFSAVSEVTTTKDGVAASAACDAKVVVAGQEIDSNEGLQALLSPLAAGGTVVYTPPTPGEVKETFGGTKEATCTGARFRVATPAGVTEYVYGRTFSTASPASDTAPAGTGGPVDTGGGPVGGFTGTGDVGTPSDLGFPVDDSTPTQTEATVEEPTEEPAPPPTDDGGDDVAGGPGLVERRIDALPVAIGTGLAAAIFPLGVWLLLGVTGSLARGRTGLRLPPFHDATPAP